MIEVGDELRCSWCGVIQGASHDEFEMMEHFYDTHPGHDGTTNICVMCETCVAAGKGAK